MLICYSENCTEICPPLYPTLPAPGTVKWAGNQVELHSAHGCALDHSLIVTKSEIRGDGYRQRRHSALTIIILKTSPSSWAPELRPVSA